MTTISLELEDDLSRLLAGLDQPVQKAAVELMVLEPFRRGSISGGKAAELLSMNRIQFLEYASSLGLAVMDMGPEQWKAELKSLNLSMVS